MFVGYEQKLQKLGVNETRADRKTWDMLHERKKKGKKNDHEKDANGSPGHLAHNKEKTEKDHEEESVKSVDEGTPSPSAIK